MDVLELLDVAFVPALGLAWLCRAWWYWRRRRRDRDFDRNSVRGVRLALGGIAVAMLWAIHGKMELFVEHLWG